MPAVPTFSRAQASLALALLIALSCDAPARAGEALAAAAPDDYYTRRAAKILKRDAALEGAAPHPLAKAYPNHSVVVCTGGCTDDGRAEVVFLEQKEDAAKVAAPLNKPASGAAVALKQKTIDCVGGCYDTPRHYEAVPVPGSEPAQEPRPKMKRDPFDPRY